MKEPDINIPLDDDDGETEGEDKPKVNNSHHPNCYPASMYICVYICVYIYIYIYIYSVYCVCYVNVFHLMGLYLECQTFME